MSTQEKSDSGRAYHHGNLREALLQAGRTLLEERGAPEFSLREVAKKIGVSPTAPYRHFPSKDHLSAALVVWGYEELSGEFSKPDCRGAGKVASAYVAFASSNPALFRLMFSGLGEGDEVSEASARCLGKAMHAIEEGQDCAVREGTKRALAVWCVAHGFATLMLGAADTSKFAPEVWPDLEHLAEVAADNATAGRDT